MRGFKIIDQARLQHMAHVKTFGKGKCCRWRLLLKEIRSSTVCATYHLSEKSMVHYVTTASRSGKHTYICTYSHCHTVARAISLVGWLRHVKFFFFFTKVRLGLLDALSQCRLDELLFVTMQI